MSIPLEIVEAKQRLEAGGMIVFVEEPNFELSIKCDRHDDGGFKDACLIYRPQQQWVASFRGPGSFPYEVTGSLGELTAFVISLYEKRKQTGGDFQAAFQASLPDYGKYMVREGAQALPLS